MSVERMMIILIEALAEDVENVSSFVYAETVRHVCFEVKGSTQTAFMYLVENREREVIEIDVRLDSDPYVSAYRGVLWAETHEGLVRAVALSALQDLKEKITS